MVSKKGQHKNVNMFLYKNDSYLITKYEYEQLMYQLARRHRGQHKNANMILCKNDSY